MLPPTANPTLGYIALLTVKSATSPTRPGAIFDFHILRGSSSCSSSLTTLIEGDFGRAFILSTSLATSLAFSSLNNSLALAAASGPYSSPSPTQITSCSSALSPLNFATAPCTVAIHIGPTSGSSTITLLQPDQN